MTRKKSPVRGQLTRVTVPSAGVGLAEFLEAAKARGGRPTPQAQLHDYLADVEALCGAAPTAGTALAEMRTAADALREALKTGDPHLIAVRALELGEYRYWPGTVAFDDATEPGRKGRARASAASKARKDDDVLAGFTAWQISFASKIQGKTAEQRVDAFIRSGRIKSDRPRRRLRALLRANRIPPVPTTVRGA